MSKFKMEGFGGELPAIDARLLPDNHATMATNTWLLAGRIEPIRTTIPIKTLKSSTRSVFRLPKGNPGVDYMAESYWLEFNSPFVRVIISPIAGQDDNGRYYWADGVYPRYATGDMIKQMNATFVGEWNGLVSYIDNHSVTHMGNIYVALVDNVGQPPATSPLYWTSVPEPYKLGVPTPQTSPIVSTIGGVSTTTQTRAYTYTWVSALGEEGGPAFPGIDQGKLDATWAVTLAPPTPEDLEDRDLKFTRIYRSITSSQGVASYFLVDEIPIDQLKYGDPYSDAQIVTNEQLSTLGWDPPPFDLQGLLTLPNGMVAGWRKNEVWFCEPYYPHAWPLKYKIAVPNDIVGLGVHGQSVIVLTSGNAWAATGIDPAQMALAIIQPLEACTSRLSIVNTPGGVLFSSPNGLINITASGAQNLTKDVILKDQWNARIHLETLAGAMLLNGYYGYAITLPGVFQEDAFQNDAFQTEDTLGSYMGLFISTDTRVALNNLDTLEQVHNVIKDEYTGEVMILRANQVFHVDVRKKLPNAKYRWRSKMFKTDFLQNLAAAKVYWTPPDNIEPAPTYFKMYAGADADQAENGLPLRFTSKLVQSGQMFRLPSGYKALYWQFEIEGYAYIDAIHAAGSARELREI